MLLKVNQQDVLHIPPLFHQHFTTVVNQRAREPHKHSTSLTLASCRKMAMGQSWGPLLRSEIQWRTDLNLKGQNLRATLW